MKISQKVWEIWFMVSIILVLVTLLFGTLPNSRIDYPNWWILSIVSVINFMICLSIGTNPKYNKDE